MIALITGITGQDGYYLSELLQQKGYEVHGFARRGTSPENCTRVHFGDLADPAALHAALHFSKPDLVFNLGAQSHVGASFLEPLVTWETTAKPIIPILEYARQAGCRVYQASTSEMFGTSPPPQNENSPLSPRSPYGIAKVAAHQAVQLYREAYGVYAVSGILFNHESERRPPSFVTRKITQGVAAIAEGKLDYITLGNLEAKRDWGYAPDYVKAMHLMLEQDEPKDYVIASGAPHTVREFLEEACSVAGVDVEHCVKFDDRFKRPAEVPVLLGNATKACEELGWHPEVNFKALVHRMVMHDLSEIRARKSSY